MPKCAVLNCASRNRKNLTNLSFHRLPRNPCKKTPWLEAIGSEILKPNAKHIFICSLHFREQDFNRTLDVIRLRDDALPSLHIQPSTSATEREPSEPTITNYSSLNLPSSPEHKPDRAAIANSANIASQSSDLLPPTQHETGPAAIDNNANIARLSLDLDQAKNLRELQKLRERVREQRRKIKCLHETVRRQNIKIKTYKEVIKEMEELINHEYCLV